jgi:hypothetical protein
MQEILCASLATTVGSLTKRIERYKSLELPAWLPTRHAYLWQARLVARQQLHTFDFTVRRAHTTQVIQTNFLTGSQFKLRSSQEVRKSGVCLTTPHWEQLQ